MTLAIFDLDNTLLKGDSDHAWGEFIIAKGLVKADDYRKKNDGFYQDYLNGKLDIFAYQNFCLDVIARIPSDALTQLLQNFVQDVIGNMITPQSEQLIADHRQRGHQLLIITATNEIITKPIASRLGIADLIATEAETINGRYTGKVSGVPSYSHGKITRLQSWLKQHPQLDMQGSYFYSDSRNDIPLLEQVTHPCAVDPDETLRRYALEKGWPIISLRD